MAKFSGELTGSLVFRQGNTIQTRIEPGLSALNITSSLNITGSQLTFNGSNVITRIEDLEAGSVGVSIGPLNRHSGSTNLFTGSITSELRSFTSSTNSSIEALNTYTASTTTQILNLEQATGSFLTATPSGTVSSSVQIESLGFITSSNDIESYTDLTNVPAGILSSSAQVSSLGFVTSSVSTIDSSSFATTGSNTFIGNQFITGALIPEALGSQNGIHDLGSLAKPWRDLYITTGSLNFVKDGELFSRVSGERNAIRVGNILITTASLNIVNNTGQVVSTIVKANKDFSNGGDVESTELVLLPEGLVSSSNQISALGFITSSGSGVSSYTELTSIPSGILSSSAQLTGLGFVTSSIDSTGSLINTASVNLNTVTFTKGDGSTFDITIDTGSSGGGVSSYSDLTNVPSSIISSSTQISSSGFITSQSAASLGFSSEDFDGNRIVSNTDLGDLFSNAFNAGTSGSLGDFLEAVFFPNSGPSFTSSTNFNIAEFILSGSTVTTLTATDPESQALTFSTQSSYTADLVKVSSGGVVTLNAVPTTETFNTVNRGDGTNAHQVQVQVSDTFGATATTSIFIDVTANSAPVFRQTSVAGSIITSFTANRNENAGATEVGKIYFTDTNSDTITIRSASDANGHFSLTKYSTYVQINQVTSSLDFENITAYNFSITASDEHFENSQDSDSVTTLPITINVTDNLNPTINNQTLSSISENSSNGATVGSIAASDSEGDTITFNNFNLSRLELDNVEVSQSTYGGTSQATDPHENPFQMSNTGTVTRKNGVFINSDLINEYQYTVQVVDQFNSASNQATITIPITDDPAPTISDNWSAGPYIIESAVSGDQIKVNANGRTGTQARFTSDQSVSWVVNPTTDFAIDSSGDLTVNRNISGSSDTSGSTIAGSVTASNSFGTTTSTTFNVSVTTNNAPDIIFSDTSANLNTNGARSGSTLTTITFSDVEGDALNHNSFVFSEGSGNINAYRNGNIYYAQPTTNLAAGTYTYNVTIEDVHGFRSNTESHSVTIAQATVGTLSTNGTFYIIESATSGSNIVTNSNGRTGTQGDLNVTYSPQYNSAAVQAFTSSNAAIAVETNGNLSINLNLSGSTTSSGDDILSDITYQDQYGNVGSGSITVNVTLNTAPTVSITDNGLNTDQAVSGSNIASISITESENESPYILTLTGAGAGSLNAIPQNAASSSWNLQPTASLAAGIYAITASADDTFARTGTATADLVVTLAADYGLTYIYTSTRTGAGTLSADSYDGILGITSISAGTPPTISGFQSAGPSPIFELKDGHLGNSSITVGGGVMSLRSTQSGSNLDANISASFAGDGSSSDQILIIFPSGSDLTGIPTSMTDSTGGSTAGEYVLFQKLSGESSFNAASSIIHKFTLGSSHDGFNDYFIIGRQSAGTFASAELRLIPSSGSAPS